jgi:FkbM family methyltransferase
MSASRIVTFPSGVTYLVPAELVEYFARTGGEPEKALIEWARRYLSPAGVFVDIGAHIGTYTLSYATWVREIHSFEPQQDTYYRLCGGIGLLGATTIHAHRVALSDDSTAEAELRVLTLDGGLSSICDLPTNHHPARTERVRVRTLDSYELSEVCLVKLDVEGNELNVLRGATETLRRSGYPPLLVEVWLEEWFRAEREALAHFLGELGYSAVSHTDFPAGFPHMLCYEHAARRALGTVPDVALPSDSERRKRLVLTMIVRNESRVIERCLRAVLPHVEGYAIVDTGSVDGTPALIARLAAEHGVRGTVERMEWKNFGFNRTASARLGRDWIRARGWDPADTYLLFLDADMTLQVEASFDIAKLTQPSYYLMQRSAGLEYPNTRLACAAHDWVSHGVTHEYWGAAGVMLGTSSPPGMWIEDGNDGGNRADKYERDRQLLEQGLIDEPTNERYMFYLAQTYFDLGEYQSAVELYERRWHAGGFAEEKWYARFKWGRALLALGSRAGVDMLLQAFEENPRRVESLFYLCVQYREEGKNAIALMLIDRARAIPPSPGALFVETDIADWRLDWEEAIVCYYLGELSRGRRAADRVSRLERAGIPYEHLATNQVHYTEPLMLLASGAFLLPESFRMQDGTAYESSSPTLAPHGDHFVLGIRLVNYDHAKGKYFVSRAPDHVIRTRELTALWQPGREPSEYQEIAQNIPSDWPAAPVDGLEDQRFVTLDGRVWFTANTWRAPTLPGRPQMVLGRLSSDLASVEHLVPLRFAAATATEKNWLPFVDGGRLRIVYGYDPLVVVEVDPESGECTEIARHAPPWRTSRFRGSAGPVAHPTTPGHWLLLVHEVALLGDERIYCQRLVELRADYQPLALSAPFFIDHRGVEYPLGFVALDGERTIITYGREERESRYAIVAWSELLGRLLP